MFSSIRRTLIGGYALILAAVLVTFGTALYWQAAASTLDGVDATLTDRANALAGSLEWDDHDGWELSFSDDYLRAVGAGTYFRVWDPSGAVMREGGDPGPIAAAPATGSRTRGDRREVEIEVPGGPRVLVGRSIAAEKARLATLLATVVATGLGVLVIALCVGLWLAGRTLAPVASMTTTAASISARDLSGRLDEERCPTELRGLARTINATLDRLGEALDRQARFTADASHELRTPVTIVRTQAELALKRGRTVEEYRAALGACLRAAQRMTGLVEGLLTLARGDADREPIQREPVALDTLAREATELLQGTAEAEGLRLSCATEPITIAGDFGLLTQMLSNLISNGLRYNRRGGSVEVTLVRELDDAVLRVTDDGIGIPADAQPHLFERFFRVDPARSRERGGSGLGLAITLRIVAAHGGSIDVASQPDAGSTFTVRLPAALASIRAQA